MFIRLENSSGVPIVRQVRDQIVEQIATGVLAEGERLPSVRELGRQLAVNQNTILRVYERLAADGLLERRHGNGTFVAARPTTAELRTQAEGVCNHIIALSQRAAAMGVAKNELHALIDKALTSPGPTHVIQKERDEP